MTIDDAAGAAKSERLRKYGIAFAVTLLVGWGCGHSAMSCASHVVAKRGPTVPNPSAPESVTGDMVRVAGGEFSMGAAFGDDDERPVRRVEIGDFEIDRTEVTVRSYAACVTAGACAPAGSDTYCNWARQATRADHPINCVSWQDANTFCGWAGKRLPSEMEWEFAARGPDSRKYPWGDGTPKGQLCWDGPGSDIMSGTRKGTCAVASHGAGRSPCGAEDMAGNVLEWTSDFYTPSYRSPPANEQRVNRGGSWLTYDRRDVRASLRLRMTPTRRDFTVGFRCVR